MILNVHEEFKRLCEDVSARKNALLEAEAIRDAFWLDYCVQNPLSTEVIEKMAERVRVGEPLCCNAAIPWLQENVGPLWAPVISRWAYEALACREKRQEFLEEYAQKVLARGWTPGLAEWVKDDLR